MAKITVYQKPSCTTCRKVHAALVQAGADFATVAKESSISDSASKGGDLGFVNDVPFQEMANAILALDVGDTSGVFKGPQGYYIVKLTEKKGGKPLKFEDIKDDIKNNRLLAKQQQAILDHLDKLKKKIKVEINEDLLK